MTSAELATIIPNHVPLDLRHSLKQALMRYEFGAFWPDALVMDALSGTSFLMGDELMQVFLLPFA